ncbi:MerR family DNA-binding transcriptional regulator [Planomonospora sp. ID67723]|uniref:MerR family DNA-binding transcriptional regulator n=1 Tax=Planomonospora sp. ID67723 TaxID=2738134 RepID=UPI0018C3BFDE|nr:MerR family DNA-binding transcriptional regulator [Planomonospora sp. ID67723]MBG0831433.1 MerR family DNA-binding transcriptional regulator [Planomonospora sp. ID67723]
MMSIGEFAALTGLSVKALRLYDEQGLLSPASVDPWSRHRRYSAAQFDQALRLKVARCADLPLAEAPGLLSDTESAAAVLAEHRSVLAAERKRQDAALDMLDRLLAGPVEWQTEVRQTQAQHWVGAALTETGDAEADTDRANALFGELWNRLSEAGNPPVGPFWSTFRAVPGSETEIQVLCCWPVAKLPPADWDVESGTVEPGVELVVRSNFEQDAPIVDGAAHPAVLALLTAAEVRSAEVSLAQVRQIGMFEQDRVVGVEVAVPLTG